MDILKLRAWYRTPMGHMVRRVLQTHINHQWETLKGKRVLVVGYGEPYIKLWLKESQVFCGMNGRSGSVKWPESGDSRTCLLWDDAMPFAGCTFDAIFIIHSLEFSDNADAYLAECQRVLKDDGEILIITPNRTGAWCRADDCPLGRGEPYSAGQLVRLLRHASLGVRHIQQALYVPPHHSAWLWKHSGFFEKWGQRLKPPIGGVHIVCAYKDIHAGAVFAPKITEVCVVLCCRYRHRLNYTFKLCTLFVTV